MNKRIPVLPGCVLLWKNTPSVTFGDSYPMLPIGSTGEPFDRQKPALFGDSRMGLSARKKLWESFFSEAGRSPWMKVVRQRRKG